MTWLNMINDQAAGLGFKVVAGTPKDSLHAIDVFFGQDCGPTPEVFVTDTGSYSDLTFGLVHLLGKQYRPVLADLPDQKLWRINADADYGPLNTAARGKIDLAKVRRRRQLSPVKVSTPPSVSARPRRPQTQAVPYERLPRDLDVTTQPDDETGSRQGPCSG
jgi:hypothetical protein